ncbi:MAG: polysaccharide deacetylase family protein [Burkholderiales bacterium]
MHDQAKDFQQLLLVNSFDVEPWWATVPPCVSLDCWEEMPDRSEAPLLDYLDLCDEAGVKGTFFFVGWLARRYPQRLEEVVRRGHEVGCHAMFHEDIASMSIREFRSSTRDAKAVIEDIAGTEVMAYRSPGFSFPLHRCAELFHELANMGFRIDSSISTAVRFHGGGHDRTEFQWPGTMMHRFGANIYEVPIPGVLVAGVELQVFGGGYLRLTPELIVKGLARRERYQVLYLHPHDFDADLPDIPNTRYIANLSRRLRVGNLRRKVAALFAVADVRTCGQLYAQDQKLSSDSKEIAWTSM